MNSTQSQTIEKIMEIWCRRGPVHHRPKPPLKPKKSEDKEDKSDNSEEKKENKQQNKKHE